MPREPWRNETPAEGDRNAGGAPAVPDPAAAPRERGWLWPLAIVLGLLVVVVVNVGFVVVAVSGADQVVESYLTEER